MAIEGIPQEMKAVQVVEVCMTSQFREGWN